MACCSLSATEPSATLLLGVPLVRAPFEPLCEPPYGATGGRLCGPAMTLVTDAHPIVPPPPGPLPTAKRPQPAAPTHRPWRQLPSIWIRLLIRDPAWLAVGVGVFVAWSWVMLAAIGMAERQARGNGGFFGISDLFFFLMAGWSAGLVGLTWWHAATWIERLDEGYRSAFRRLVPLRRHSWWLLLLAVLGLGLAVGASALGLYILEILRVRFQGEAGIVLALAAFVAFYAVVVFWMQRLLYRLPRRFVRALGHGLVVVMGVMPLWCAAVGLAYILPDHLDDLHRTLDLPSVGDPWEFDGADVAMVTAVMVAYAVPYVVALASTWAWLLAVLAMDRADGTPLYLRLKGHHLTASEADTFT